MRGRYRALGFVDAFVNLVVCVAETGGADFEKQVVVPDGGDRYFLEFIWCAVLVLSLSGWAMNDSGGAGESKP